MSSLYSMLRAIAREAMNRRGDVELAELPEVPARPPAQAAPARVEKGTEHDLMTSDAALMSEGTVGPLSDPATDEMRIIEALFKRTGRKFSRKGADLQRHPVRTGR